MGKLTVEEIKKMAGLAIEALEDKKDYAKFIPIQQMAI